jgi:hypothetical protein
MRATVWLKRDGDEEVSLEYEDRFVMQDEDGGIAVCEGDGLIERDFAAGSWARYEVVA